MDKNHERGKWPRRGGRKERGGEKRTRGGSEGVMYRDGMGWVWEGGRRREEERRREA